jgi:flagellar biosynthesis/type III secretory pathway M-ring protein FliF/YscJ
MKSPLTELEKKERLQRAKNKFQLIRRQLNDRKTNKHKLLALVQELASQRPEVTVQILKKWIDTSR